LISANIGKRIIVQEGDKSWTATILGIPTRSSEELEANAPDGTGPQLAQQGEYALLKTEQGTQLVHMNRLLMVTFPDDPQTTITQEEFRNLLTMQLEWPGAKAARTDKANIGMTYLQKGFRWIPQYRVTLGPNNTATVELQATLLNELADLNDVTAHLVIGVPSFDFKETLDPISLNQTVASLSQYFQTDGSQFSNNFSNSIMLQTQMGRAREVRQHVPEAAVAADVGPDIAVGQEDDLFIFTVNNVSLRKGERMVVPINRWEMKYEDLYKLSVPLAPPQELRQNFNNEQQAQLARMLHAPKVKHVIRMQNKSDAPLTTAPAIFLKEGRLIAQGMMTYTSRGSSVDLEMTTAVNVPVAFSDEEVERIPNVNVGGGTYDQINLKGAISLTNYHDKPIRIEVERMLLGVADTAGADGKTKKLSAQAESWAHGTRPAWWGWYSWPWWWFHTNSFSKVSWQAELKPNEGVELPYTWHYYWAR